MLQAVDEAFLITQQRLGRVDASDPATIHGVRLAFKKFRYMVEMLYPVLADFPKEHLKNMKNYQGAMGRIQDIEVLLMILTDFTASKSVFDPKPAIRFYEQRHADAISAYLEEKGALNVFWRPAPDRPFSWENVI